MDDFLSSAQKHNGQKFEHNRVGPIANHLGRIGARIWASWEEWDICRGHFVFKKWANLSNKRVSKQHR